MKIFIFIVLILTSYTSFSEEQDPILFQLEAQYGYLIRMSHIKPRHSARLVSMGFNLGTEVAPTRPKAPGKKSLADHFTEENQRKLSEGEKLDQVEGLVDNQIENSQLSIAQSDEEEVQELPQALMQWDGFSNCAREMLPVLKTALYLKSKQGEDATFLNNYELARSFYLERATKEGFVCGQHLNPNIEIVIDTEIMNIKVLTALLSRTGSQRDLLWRALVVGFAKQAPSTSQLQFAYYWNTLSFRAVTSKAVLPTFVELNTELTENPKTKEVILSVGKTTVAHTLVTEYTDLAANLSVGLIFLKEKGL